MKQVATKKKRRRTALVVIILLCILLSVALAGLWYYVHKDNSKLAAIKEKEEEQKQSYVSMVESVTLPGGWDQSTLDALKEKALAAYDSSLSNLIEKAENGDQEALDTVLNYQEGDKNETLSKQYQQLLENLAKYPEGLIKLVLAQPDQMDFVLAYTPGKSVDENAVVTGDLDVSMVDLKTTDPAWGYFEYGGSYLADKGSAPTAIADVFSFLLKDNTLTPLAIAEWAKEYGYDVTPVGDNDSIFGAAAYTWGVNMTPLAGYQATIAQSVDQGSPVIMELQNGSETRFVVIDGTDDQGNWVILDPSSSKGATSVNPDDIKEQIVSGYAFW